MTDLDQATMSLEMVRGDAQSGYLAISWRTEGSKGMSSQCFPVDQLHQAAQFALSLAGQAHVYVASGVLGQVPEQRGGAAAVKQIRVVTLDFDVGAEGHKANKPRPASKTDVDRLLEGLPKPTAIIDTGNGLLIIWVLENPITIETDAERQHAAALVKAFQAGVRAHARRKFGWEFDNTSDLARVIRVGGTLNHKTNPPKPVVFWDGDYAVRLSADDLQAVAQLQDARLAAAPVAGRPAAGAREQMSSGRAPNLDVIVAGCAFMEHWVCDAASLTEPEWKAGIDIAARCDEGREKVHDASKPHAGYSSSETDAKIERALAGPGPRTCANIARELDFAGCKTCPFWGQFRSPIALGYVGLVQAQLGRRYVYVAARDAFFDLRSVT